MKEKFLQYFNNKKANAIIFAILSAVLCSISTPFSKYVQGSVPPSMRAAFMYLGAGIGIGIIYLFNFKKEKKEQRLDKHDMPYFISYLFVDIFAAIFMMFGIEYGTAANSALLSNFEIVVTTTIALFIFKEKVSPKLWTGVSLILVASILLSFDKDLLKFNIGSLFIILSTICWGIENNLSKKISHKSSFEISTIKGFITGIASLLIGLAFKERINDWSMIPFVIIVGFLAYGVSIFVYLKAQSVIGAAKTSAFFALSPFIGALLSFIFLREKLTIYFKIGIVIMILGNGFAMRDTLERDKRYKAIIFDADGTIMDSIGGVINAMNKTFESYGFKQRFTNEDGKFFIGAGAEEFAKRALKRAGIVDIDLEKFCLEFLKHYQICQKTGSVPFEGITKLFSDLKKAGYKIGICSNKPQQLLNDVVKQVFPDTEFDIVYGQRQGIPCKPERDMFDKVKEQIKVKSRHILYVGDSEYDYLFAKNSKVDSCIMTYGYGNYNSDFMKHITHKCSNVKELEEMLLK